MKMFTYRKKICKFCENKKMEIDYKNPSMLRRFVTEQGKILPRRITGTCSLHQRGLVTAIKRARNIALLAYTNDVKNA
ncbi:MAG: 30S ribosomal protein S18 [Candidatus Marinimicrobia bacterium]|jgi:small subunit ribosomal protein S18|nr:30S ribosomal protein S18 [Candidatus Neomarinimicrobiota bacterium]MBT4945701.1 30S ribosomal protein S18 [Candidatus Neomarinimicrobiota bacterium]MBT5269298.1 30S ribosomal protein S18 [Candidatus Neomarinimicrobiota bacterium]MBT6012287.1 30S ribosomal protein S18 [Candidatus Neomarinimicrobiota bacterium]